MYIDNNKYYDTVHNMVNKDNMNDNDVINRLMNDHNLSYTDANRTLDNFYMRS